MKYTIVGTTIVLATTMSGCSSLNSMITSGFDKFTGSPESFASSPKAREHEDNSIISDKESIDFTPIAERTTHDKVLKIAHETIGEVQTDFDYDYKNVYTDVAFKPTLEDAADGVSMNFSWESPRGFYPPGIYDVMRTSGHNGREAVAFNVLIGSALTKMIKKLDAVGVGYEVHTTYYGQSDGIPMKYGRGVIYRGEYGTISMPKSITTLNGKPHSFHIQPGKTLSNTELAATRAFGLQDFVNRGSVGISSIVDNYQITTTTERGSEHRYAKVTFIIKEKGKD